MSTFKAYLKKESLESIRQYKFFILAIGIISFAILDPFMLKLLPKILGSQFTVDIDTLFTATPRFAVNNYIKDLTQIGYIVVVFTLSGILNEEIISERLVFPYSQGANPAAIVLAKVVHYAFLITFYIFIGFIIAYLYGGMILEGDRSSFLETMKSALCLSIFFFFSLSLVVFLSSIVKKSFIVGFLAIFINGSLSLLVKLDSIGRLIPNNLIVYANNFTLQGSLLTIISTMLLSIVLISLAIYRMNKVEVI